MSSRTGPLVFTNQTPRRQGLTAARYKGPHLLQKVNGSPSMAPKKNAVKTIRAPSGKKRLSMNPKPAAEEAEDVNRAPEDSSDDEFYSANIPKTNFDVGAQKAKEQGPAGTRNNKPVINAQGRSSSSPLEGTRLTRRSTAPNSSDSHGSPKRKSQEDPQVYGQGMADALGFTKVAPTKKPRQRYGRASSYVTSEKAKSSQSKGRGKDEEDVLGTPPRRFIKIKAISPISDLESEEEVPAFKVPGMEGLDDRPLSTPESKPKFKRPPPIPSPLKEDNETPQRQFKTYGGDGLNTPFQKPSADPESPLGLSKKLKGEKKTVVEESPLTQLPVFKTYDMSLIDDVVSATKTIVKEDRPPLPSFTATQLDFADPTQTQAQRPCCPMCTTEVDPSWLRDFGPMVNIRKQQRFHKLHKIRKAKEDKKRNGYPDIEWDKLDDRITKHHSFIKKLINGADSHFRKAHSETVDAGKDRNYMTSTSNLTPGYYGTRGLRAISENIMRKFTPLLKKRMVEDRLMSARGFTPYVHSVLVLEVAVLLIAEDMKVDGERAREILEESRDVGELLNEELRDVVMKEVVESDSESGSGEEFD